MTSERSDLKIGIIDAFYQSDSKTTSMMEMLGFIEQQNILVRGKCMIIVIDNDNSTYEPFLRFGWQKKYLDLSVVELVAMDGSEMGDLGSLQRQKSRAYVHIYNPFKKVYSKEILAENILIFPDKLKNLHKYPLNVFSSSSMFKKNDSTSMLLIMQNELLKAFAQALNFEQSPIDDEIVDQVMNLSYAEPVRQEQVDFLVLTGPNISDDLTNELTHGKFFESSHFVIDLRVRECSNVYLVIGQHKLPETLIPFSFLKTLGIFWILSVAFWILSRLLKFDMKNWTIVKISSTLLGASNDNRRPLKSLEMLSKMCVYAVSGLIAFYLNDDMMNILLPREKYLNLRNLKDLSESGLDVYMSDLTKYYLGQLLPNDAYMKTILKRAEVYDIMSDSSDWTDLPSKSHDIRLFLACFQFGHGRRSRELFIFENVDIQNSRFTLIDEPLSRGERIVYMKPNEFLLDNFMKIMMKLLDTGIIGHWESYNYPRNWLWWHVQRYKTTEDGMYSETTSEQSVETPLHIRLILVLDIGYSIASVVLVIEILWQRIGRNIQFSQLLLYKILFPPLH
ncbi:hypothetical protein QAD02_004511 [Eretmocerus hayati]|uniref:Uncharacterized protein n=1 Tax=Eretmocerus hayati TaxID=131215 RepID=A0ACC2NSG9_9HYME|nr:hypothetical protein QAD02_004511 [Eretmocerus hayati]